MNSSAFPGLGVFTVIHKVEVTVLSAFPGLGVFTWTVLGVGIERRTEGLTWSMERRGMLNRVVVDSRTRLVHIHVRCKPREMETTIPKFRF